MRSIRKTSLRAMQAATLAVAFGVAGCAPQFSNHGYIPPQEDLDQLEIGTDTRESVAEKVGVPVSSGVLNDSGYYYVRMRTRTIGPLAPQEIDRQVLSISFNQAGRLQNIERFGLERGQVVPLERRVTSSPVSDQTFLRQLLGNIGRFNPAAFGS